MAAGAVGRGRRPADVHEPVGQLDLAPTFCEIAGVPAPEWMQGAPLPTAPGSGRERVLCEWDSQFPGYGMHLRSIYRDGWLCTAYEKSTVGEPNGLEKFFAETGHVRRRNRARRARSRTKAPRASCTRSTTIRTSGRTAGTIPRARRIREDLVADLYDNLPEETQALEGGAPGLTAPSR